MRRSTVRIFALFVLALLGAPVTMHVVLHDLHDHHDAHADAAMIEHGGGHGDHEHPIVAPPAPPVPNLARAALPVVATLTVASSWTRIATAERSVIALGALRTDTDVGLQPFLATFLI